MQGDNFPGFSGENQNQKFTTNIRSWAEYETYSCYSSTSYFLLSKLSQQEETQGRGLQNYFY